MCNMHDIAFINVKFHLPLGFQVTKSVCSNCTFEAELSKYNGGENSKVSPTTITTNISN